MNFYLDGIAIIISVISVIYTMKSNKKTYEFDEYKERVREIERKEDTFLTKEELRLAKNEARINIIPYFHLEFTDRIKLINDEILELPITLVNVGRDTATNIALKPLDNDNYKLEYFKVSGYETVYHGIRSYFDKQFATTGGAVNFVVACNKHDAPSDVYFTLKYNDLVGRCYEQEFRFQYCKKISDEFSMNHTSFPPVCFESEI